MYVAFPQSAIYMVGCRIYRCPILHRCCIFLCRNISVALFSLPNFPVAHFPVTQFSVALFPLLFCRCRFYLLPTERLVSIYKRLIYHYMSFSGCQRNTPVSFGCWQICRRSMSHICRWRPLGLRIVTVWTYDWRQRELAEAAGPCASAIDTAWPRQAIRPVQTGSEYL